MDKELIKIQLDKILQSRQFNKSKISCDLLSYLVQASLDDKNLKEFTIGIDLFGKKYDQTEKQDANIRVYIHTLRKKLQDYYESEGSKDPIVFEVEKGKYRVRFKSRKEHQAKQPASYRIPFLISILVIAIIGSIGLFTKDQKSNTWAKLPVWHEFASSNKKTLLVLGDYFVFSGVLPTGNIGVYRDFSINSEVEFEHLLDKNPGLVKSVSKSPLTYLSKMSAFCQNDIQRVFAQTGTEISVKLSSDIQPTDLKDYNIIFVGNYKNMGLFENTIREMKFTFNINADSKQFITSVDPCAEVYAPGNNDLKETDYSLVVYTKGYADNIFLFFLSAHDIGNISTVSRLTNPEYLKQFASKQLSTLKSDSFKALYKVEGINKTDLTFELLRVE